MQGVLFAVFCASIAGLAATTAATKSDGERTFIHLSTTAERIQSYGYPAETHTVQTADGYILTMFRIPYSPRLQNTNVSGKPVVFLLHGLLSSSDCWLLNGPDNAIAFLLADAGYDVWLGNCRGNTYSRKHATKSPLLPPFWQFSWHEMGVHDLPTLIDYILYWTGEQKLHYVAHSQGTTALFVCLSELPGYGAKLKTMHMLAPAAFMANIRSPIALALAPLLGTPSALNALIGSSEFMPSSALLALLATKGCNEQSAFQVLCANVLFLIAGWDSKHLNYTLLEDIVQSHPAGASTNQLIHYLQEFKSGGFRQYDYGMIFNQIVYGRHEPPDYQLANIASTEVPIDFYYSDNDFLAAPEDVLKLARRLGNESVRLHHVQYEDWNHLDFLWALEVKEVIYDAVLKTIDDYENEV